MNLVCGQVNPIIVREQVEEYDCFYKKDEIGKEEKIK